MIFLLYQYLGLTYTCFDKGIFLCVLLFKTIYCSFVFFCSFALSKWFLTALRLFLSKNRIRHGECSFFIGKRNLHITDFHNKGLPFGQILRALEEEIVDKFDIRFLNSELIEAITKIVSKPMDTFMVQSQTGSSRRFVEHELYFMQRINFKMFCLKAQTEGPLRKE